MAPNMAREVQTVIIANSNSWGRVSAAQLPDANRETRSDYDLGEPDDRPEQTDSGHD